MSTPNSNPLEDKPGNGTSPRTFAVPKQTANVPPRIVPTLGGVGSVKPASAQPHKAVIPPSRPTIHEVPHGTELSAKVPQAASPGASEHVATAGGKAGAASPADGASQPSGAVPSNTMNGTGRSTKTAKLLEPDLDPSSGAETPVHQYYLPDGMQPEDLPPGIRPACVELVDNCMRELVVAETNPLTKTIAGTLPFDTFMAVLLERQLAAVVLSDHQDPNEVARLTGLLDRAMQRKQRTETLLLKQQTVELQRRRLGPLGYSH